MYGAITFFVIYNYYHQWLLLVAVEKSLALEQLQQTMSEAVAELTSKLEQVEGERNKLNTENEELAKRM